jgi:hypothetical protein
MAGNFTLRFGLGLVVAADALVLPAAARAATNVVPNAARRHAVPKKGENG